MATPKDYFHTPEHAEIYKKYRRDAPLQCIKKTVAFLSENVDPKTCCAIDVGCGSGQATFPLAPYFKQVFGVDTSEPQLEEGRNDPRATINTNVEFKVSEAESLPLQDKSVHLVFAKDAAHWFDFERFCKEVDRVLAPNGVLALCTLNKPLRLVGHETEGAQILNELKEKTRDGWMNDKIFDWTSFYDNMELPYKQYIRDYSTEDEYEISVADHINYWRTISGIHNFIKSNPEKGEIIMKETTDKLMKLVKSNTLPEKTILTYKRPYILLLARKPK